MNFAHQYKHFYWFCLSRKGVLPLNDGKRKGNVAISHILRSIKDPARLQWHAVKKVDHYYLSIDAVTQPILVREESVPYEKQEKW